MRRTERCAPNFIQIIGGATLWGHTLIFHELYFAFKLQEFNSNLSILGAADKGEAARVSYTLPTSPIPMRPEHTDRAYPQSFPFPLHLSQVSPGA